MDVGSPGEIRIRVILLGVSRRQVSPLVRGSRAVYWQVSGANAMHSPMCVV